MMLDDPTQAALSYQGYAPQPTIAGVSHQPLKKHRALEGAFMEHLRLEGGLVAGLPGPFEVKQLSVSWAAPGRINAFHIHPKRPQDELWCVLQGELLVWLVDVRATGPSRGRRCSFLLSGEAPSLLEIPSGVGYVQYVL